MKTISKELEQELRDDLYSLLNNKNVNPLAELI